MTEESHYATVRVFSGLLKAYLQEEPMEPPVDLRQQILVELLETEREYVQDLRMLIENCFDRLRPVSWLPIEQKCQLIRNANDLLCFQTDFLTALEQEMARCKDISVAKVFLEMQDRFQVYTQYCTQHDGAIQVLKNLEQKPEMMLLLKDFEGKTPSRLAVRDYLIKPVQRICRYPLILQNLIHQTPNNSPHLKILLQAHSAMQHVAADIDAAKWYLDTLQRTDRFFARTEPVDRLDFPNRNQVGNMLLGGVLITMYPDGGCVKSRFRGVFAFAEYLLIVRVKRSVSYQVKACLQLKHHELVTKGLLSHSWSLVNKVTGVKYDFVADSEKEKAIWIRVLELAMKNNPVRQDTLEVTLREKLAPMKRTFSMGSLHMLRQSGHCRKISSTLDDKTISEPVHPMSSPVRRSESLKSFWNTTDSLPQLNIASSPTPKRGPIDIKLLDVVTPHLESVRLESIESIILNTNPALRQCRNRISSFDTLSCLKEDSSDSDREPLPIKPGKMNRFFGAMFRRKSLQV